jgi:hypothetical protein
MSTTTHRRMHVRLALGLVAAVAAAAIVTLAPAPPASAETPKGLIFVTCTPSDGPSSTVTPSQAELDAIKRDGRTWTKRSNTDLVNFVLGDLKTYFRKATLGGLTNFNYFGWVRVDQTMNQFFGPGTSSFTQWQQCRDKAAATAPGLPAGYGVVVMLPGPWCMQGNSGWACVTTGGDAADIAHEASHALGLSHSWGGTPTKEYGDYYSITGYTAGGGYQYTDPVGSRWGPGYSAPDLQLLGYLPQDRVFAAGWPGVGSRYTITLTALSHYLDGGTLMARFLSGLGQYLTIEYRTKDGPDAGIPGSRVVIHELGSIVDMRAAVTPGGSTTVHGLSIKTQPASGNRVTVTVQQTFPNILYNVQPNGDLMCTRHNGYITGDPSWTSSARVGWGWGGFTHLFTTSGSIYGLLPDGRLLWYRHNGADACTFDWNPAGGTTVLTGLTNVKYMFGMPTDETPGGIIYVVTKDGRLLWYRHNGWGNGSAAWDGPVQVGSGWNGVKKVFPGAEGVIYAVDANGDLWWYRHLGYKTGANTWQGWRNLVGTGWGGFKKLVGGSPDGVIYGILPDGQVRWYRHIGWLNGTAAWDPYGGTVVRFGWAYQKFVFQRSWTPTRPF